MKLLNLMLFLTVCYFCTSVTYAEDLPANPWTAKAPTPNNGIHEDASEASDLTVAPFYKNGANDGEIVAVDPWARARDRSGIVTWRGSGQHGKLNYVGEGTVFENNNYGQEQIAPEVNRHNIVVMLDHLRNLGYKIPTSWNENVQNVPQKYRTAWLKNYSAMNSSSDPFSKMTKGLMRSFENLSGLDAENLILNTVDLLGTD